MQMPSYRQLNLLGFLVCACLLAFAAYLQFHDGIQPCPLCIMQRAGFALLGILFIPIIFIKLKRKPRIIYGCVMVIVALVSLSISIRQIWLQHLPASEAPACGPGLYYIVKNLPFQEAMKMLFQGTAECALVKWTFLGFSIAEWSLVFFVILLILIVFQMFRKKA